MTVLGYPLRAKSGRLQRCPRKFRSSPKSIHHCRARDVLRAVLLALLPRPIIDFMTASTAASAAAVAAAVAAFTAAFCARRLM
jgi:hypothetical protein